MQYYKLESTFIATIKWPQVDSAIYRPPTSKVLALLSRKDYFLLELPQYKIYVFICQLDMKTKQKLLKLTNCNLIKNHKYKERLQTAKFNLEDAGHLCAPLMIKADI